MQFPFKVIESKYTTRKEFNVTDGHQPTHAVFYLKKGRFEIETEGGTEEVKAGDCYILPDYVYYRRKVLEPIEFVYVKFMCNENCPYTLEIPFGKVNFADEERFLSNITALEKLLPKDDYLSAGCKEHLLLDILFQIYFENITEEQFFDDAPCHDIIVNCATEYIRNNLKEKILIEQICRHAGTNPSTLNFKFRRQFNLSAGQFIVRERINRAKKLLTGTSYSISEIATRCGFENVYYFSNVFKKETGMSPLKFRNTQ
ncbi:MAG: helix-turn-helix transcriptional regulator [Clostridia bacterium]|nr:helix-turn-helix transcriptional regulator [Clostridia bacterium]MBQ9997708.1 helix-turn-helix transcriptional regulator [Clostridia bacterium]